MTKWVEHASHTTNWIRGSIINIGTSIWWSTEYNKGRGGMVEFSVAKDKVINVIKYPPSIKPSFHCCILYKGLIYIIPGSNKLKNITSFDPITHKFNELVSVYDKHERYYTYDAVIPSCVIINDRIYIFYQEHHYQDTSICWMYSPHNNTLRRIGDSIPNMKQYVSLINYKQRILRFGGKNQNNFFMSNVFEEEKVDDIEWKRIAQYKLNGIYKSGYINYKDVVIIFGGAESQNIYVINLNCENGVDDGCKKINMVTPDSGGYLAVLVPMRQLNEIIVYGYCNSIINKLSMDIMGVIHAFYTKYDINVHLFSRGLPFKHYSMSLGSILRDEHVEPSPKNEDKTVIDYSSQIKYKFYPGTCCTFAIED